jgi:hypothetical protein
MSQMPSAPTEALLLPVTDLTHLFNTPSVNPLSKGLSETLGVSGVEYLMDQLRHEIEARCDSFCQSEKSFQGWRSRFSRLSVASPNLGFSNNKP